MGAHKSKYSLLKGHRTIAVFKIVKLNNEQSQGYSQILLRIFIQS